MPDDDIRIPASEREQVGRVTRDVQTSIVMDRSAWRKLANNVVRTEGVQRMTRVRDACRQQSGLNGYMLSVEGPGRLPPFAPIATVITADLDAIKDNAANQRLLANFSLAAG